MAKRGVSRSDFGAFEARLRPELLELQHRCQAAGLALVVLIEGADAAGKTRLTRTLVEWLDPRRVRVWAADRAEAPPGRPGFERFWRVLPARGRGAIYLGGWYRDPVLRRGLGRLKGGAFRRALARARRFEDQLLGEGVVLARYWLEVPEAEARRRLRKLEASKRTRFRVSPRDWLHLESFEAIRAAGAAAREATDRADSPWRLVDGRDRRAAAMAVLEDLRGRLALALAAREDAAAAPATPDSPPPVAAASGEGDGDPGAEGDDPSGQAGRLGEIDLGARLDRAEYDDRRKALALRLDRAARACAEKGRSAVFVFEGCDAAGKGGAIRRALGAIHPRLYRAVSTAAPDATERRYPYLWRFWRDLPGPGDLGVFDRSWYGRVLVERVEGFCSDADWRRAYDEIRDFEAQLVGAGIPVVKFWLHISQDEQLRRFRAREETPHKRWKITPEDWRNREKWPAYRVAVEDMLARTDTPQAPWHLVASEDKPHARVAVMEVMAAALEGLAGSGDGAAAPPAGRPEGKDAKRREGKKKRKKKRRG